MHRAHHGIDEKFDNPRFRELLTYYRYGISTSGGLNFYVLKTIFRQGKCQTLMEIHQGFLNYEIFNQRRRLIPMESKRRMLPKFDVKDKGSVLNYLLVDSNPNIGTIVYQSPMHILIDLSEYLLKFKFNKKQTHMFTKLSKRLCSCLIVQRMFDKMPNILFSLRGFTYHDFLRNLREVILNYFTLKHGFLIV